MKLCKDCKWFDKAQGVGGFGFWSVCRNPSVSQDHVWGTPSELCELARQDDDQCGPEGKHWEQREVRPSFWRRLLGGAA